MNTLRYTLLCATLAVVAFLPACNSKSQLALPAQGTFARNSLANAAPAFLAVPLPRPFKPHAIMSDGKIVGSSSGAAAVYYNGTLAVLGRYNGLPTYATSINDAGVAVGYADLKSRPHNVPLEFSGGTIARLPFVHECG